LIFVTVGHQMPFDRMVRAVDQWAARSGRRDIFAQIGETDYRPAHLQWSAHLAPADFERRMREADSIVAHAGTGTIISAVRLGKPLLVMPRLSRLGETRNDHQVATCKHFGSVGYVLVATDEHDLPSKVEQLATFRPSAGISEFASAELIRRISDFIHAT
jgi:UDP-N-acetylglucosamine transferase subunit ALG13